MKDKKMVVGVLVWIALMIWFASLEVVQGFGFFAVVSLIGLGVLAATLVYVLKKSNTKSMQDFGTHIIFIPDGAEVYNALTMRLDTLGINYVVNIKAKSFACNSGLLRCQTSFCNKNSDMCRDYIFFDGMVIKTINGSVIGNYGQI